MANHKYKWRDGMPKPKVSAATFGKFAEKIGGGSAQRATAQQLVSAARNSPIHALFNWDDKKAAHAHRISQAVKYLGGLLIVHVRTESGTTQSTRAYHVVNVDGGRGYVHHDRIISEPDLRAQVIAQAKTRLEAFIASYVRFAALSAYIPRLQEIVEAMHAEIEEIEQAAITSKGRAPRRQRAASPELQPAL